MYMYKCVHVMYVGLIYVCMRVTYVMYVRITYIFICMHVMHMYIYCMYNDICIYVCIQCLFGKKSYQYALLDSK